MEPLNDIRRLANLLDTKFRGPFGFRFGWDGILGLIPGLGDIFTSGLSFFVIYRAAQLGCPPVLLLRMSGNVIVENILDVIPGLGNIFDFFWKSNQRNLALVEAYLQSPQRTVKKSWLLVTGTLLFIFLLIAAILVGVILLLKEIYQFVAVSL